MTSMMKFSGSNEPVLRKAVQDLTNLLTPGETLQALAIQELFAALLQFQRRSILAATSGRLIFISRPLLGGFNMQDLRWQDLRDARINEGFWGANISINSVQGAFIKAEGLNKIDAKNLYVYAQSQEQAWREKNRVRMIEENRMMSPVANYAHVAPPASSQMDPMIRLQQAKTMLDQGLITDAEYEAIKAKAISGL